jgi:hypothetical protein
MESLLADSKTVFSLLAQLQNPNSTAYSKQKALEHIKSMLRLIMRACYDTLQAEKQLFG